jgi:hypothetical protein
MTRLQRDEYLKQINKVNDEIVEKKNARNNVLIGNVLGLIRDSGCRDDGVSKRKGSGGKGKEKSKVNDITGP